MAAIATALGPEGGRRSLGSMPYTTEEIRAAIAAFLKSAKQPALLEPGEELLPITED